MKGTPMLNIRFLKISVNPATAAEVVNWIDSVDRKSLLLNHNLHSAYLMQKEQAFRSLYERADLTVIDGMPILLAARRYSEVPLSSSCRIGSTDWIAELSRSNKPGKLALLGASAASNQQAVQRLNQNLIEYGWDVVGLNGFVTEREAVAWLNNEAPDLVLVGMGMPLQETFLESHWDELPAAVYATVGGAIDYVAGVHKLAPRAMGRLGLEWFWRLMHDPGRLARRYLIEPILLLALLTRPRARRRGASGSMREKL